MSAAKESTELIGSVVHQVSQIVSEMAGIQLGPKQSSMVENRLKTRMVRLGLDSFQDYLTHLKNHRESESQVLLSLMTTHHTYFFREFSHFEYLLNRSLPGLIEKARTRQDKTIHVWSAACSRGQEVYSLAMFFRFHLSQMAPEVKFKIWGTDIDPESVRFAENGVYKADELKQSPAMYVEGNWVRGKESVKDFTKAKDQIKQHCRFGALNLLKPDSFLNDKKFDVVFCRNVFIYFNQDQIKQVTKLFMQHLDQDGVLVLGVSETLNGLGLELDLCGPSIYQFRKAKVAGAFQPKVAAAVVKPKIMDILSVDDSPTILALLKKVLIAENGFRVKATAKNGREALELLKTQSFDAITLDLHMPELDGVGFLKQHDSKKIPVVVVSSINREDPTIARQAIQYGACDYVEKPSLDNLAQAGNEIRAKLRTVLQGRTSANVVVEKSPSLMPAQSKKIKVLIVDDSLTIRQLLQQLISKDPRFEVVGLAERPSQVEELILKTKPDVITMDIHMPEMDGVTLLKKIQPKYQIPTVMITSIQKEEGPLVLQALEAGAVDYIQKPSAKDLGEVSLLINERLQIAAQANLKGRGKLRRSSRSLIQVDQESLVLIGASTGGTEAIKTVLEGMPQNIPPILIVQHIPPIFSAAFAQRLDSLFPFEVREAKDGDRVLPNQVLIAPGGKQMGLNSHSGQLFVAVSDAPPMNRHKPSVDFLFQSAAGLKISKMVAAVLTGMGADGARQLKVLRDMGARTIAQDESTSVVYGMPKEAAAMGGAEFILPLDQVAEKISGLCNETIKRKKVAV